MDALKTELETLAFQELHPEARQTIAARLAFLRGQGADLIRDIEKDLRRVLAAHDVPVLQSPVLARALFAHTEIDGEIPSALYTAVAQVLAYVYQIKAAMQGQGRMPSVQPDPHVPSELDPHNQRDRNTVAPEDRT